MMSVATDVAVIGAGPSGLGAAIAAANAGARVDVVDSAPAGDEDWLQSSTSQVRDTHSPHRALAGSTALEAARRAGVRLHFGAEIWGIFPGYLICATQAGQPLELSARSVILATGACDRVVAFPGWTLPGVVTAGAAARMARTDRLALGRRVVIAGSGPFLLSAGRAVERAGGSIAAYVEARPIDVRLMGHVARNPSYVREAFGLFRPRRSRRITRRFGWVIKDALGDEHVEAVRIIPSAAAPPLAEARTETIGGVDALVVGWGFMPSIELSALLLCRHAYDESRGGWYCVTDPFTGRTSVSGVYAAGETTGVSGGKSARLSGILAGRAAAIDLGFPPADLDARSTIRRLSRERERAAEQSRVFALPRLSASLATDDTIVCRCENVTLAQVRSAIAEGAETVAGIKRTTRAGMGECQGRMCESAVARAVVGDEGDVAKAGFNHPRIPVRSVPLSIVEQTLEHEPTRSSHA